MTVREEYRERVILVAVCEGSEAETAVSLRELADLAATAGAEVVETVVQNRENIHPSTYVGSGKLEEIKEMLYFFDADGIICDDELSPAQLHNLADELECKVCDRTLLILDIFASRARTKEGRIQVELAQLRYRASRLAGLRTSLSRLGGGIGTRGPGEKKLEIDRRVISERITTLKKELEDVVRHRDVLRSGRRKGEIQTAAIVGYTNAGKSTLLNKLTGAAVLEQDALFATLDPTTRIFDLPQGGQMLLTDTVGFIRKLPHHLIDAFKSTLEEAVYADMIIHVVDASSPDMTEQMNTVYETLDMLGVKNKPVLTLFNKIDKRTDDDPLTDSRADRTLKISAKHRIGLEEIPEAINDLLYARKLYIERVYPYDQGRKVALIRMKGQLVSEEFTPDGIAVKAYIPLSIYNAVDI